LMWPEEKMKKVKLLSSGATMVRWTNNGKLSILMKTVEKLRKDLTRTGDSISTDHSTSSQDFQCTEWWNA
jgi:hypothetical protein